jgi:hypothetical protein
MKSQLNNRTLSPAPCARRSKSRTMLVAILAFTAALCFALPAFAQDVGPLPSPPPPQSDGPVPETVPNPDQAPAQPAPAPSRSDDHSTSPMSYEKPTIPVDQIIQRFAAREEEFKEERDNFTYVQDFIVQTIDDSGQVDGEYHLTTDVTFTPDGHRYEKVIFAPPPSLERISLSEQDLDDLKNVQPFVLTTTELPKYDINYVGRQRLDEIGTYVFDVAPKRIEKNQRYFQGRIWVDDRDLEIVKTDGKAVPDIRKNGNENVFPRFETYRENIEGHYWFPTYTHADDVLRFSTGGVHVRMIVRYSHYKRFRVTVRLLSPGAPGTPGAPETAPSNSPPPPSSPNPPPPPPSTSQPNP